MNSKKSLREKLIKARQLIKPEDACLAADSIEKHLLEIISENAKVAIYCAIRGEVDLNMVIEKLQSRGNQVALPVVTETEKILKFLDCSSGEELVVGKFGISCPMTHLPEIEPDTVIVPMVGFDLHGNRLGYGGGYYDATLKFLRIKNKKLLVIGVAYAMQQVNNLPIHDGDEKMDMVITEKGIIRFV